MSHYHQQLSCMSSWTLTSIIKLETKWSLKTIWTMVQNGKQHTHSCSQRPAPSVTSLNTYDNRCHLAPAALAKSMCLRSVKTARRRRSTLTQTQSETFQIQQSCTVCQVCHDFSSMAYAQGR